jgi:hypothetical protein
MGDDDAGSAYARSSKGLQPMAENAVIGFLSDARSRNGMRAGDMRSGQAFSELVAALQLMSD